MLREGGPGGVSRALRGTAESSLAGTVEVSLSAWLSLGTPRYETAWRLATLSPTPPLETVFLFGASHILRRC